MKKIDEKIEKKVNDLLIANLTRQAGTVIAFGALAEVTSGGNFRLTHAPGAEVLEFGVAHTSSFILQSIRNLRMLFYNKNNAYFF